MIILKKIAAVDQEHLKFVLSDLLKLFVISKGERKNRKTHEDCRRLSILHSKSREINRDAIETLQEALKQVFETFFVKLSYARSR